MKKHLKRLLFGRELPQEYICVDALDFDSHVQISAKWKNRNDWFCIGNKHLLLGYKPLLIGILEEDLSEGDLGAILCMQWFFEQEKRQKSCASLWLCLLEKKAFGSGTLYIFQGLKGTHSFIASHHQLAYQLKESLQKRPASQLPLQGNLYDQVRIAYAYPRLISLITLTANGKMNMFPTDLNGPLGKDYYILSLRSAGKAYAQLQKTEKCLLTHVKASRYREVYSLGKNHMQEMKDVAAFEIEDYSSELKLPIPPKSVEYRELIVREDWEVGIHTLILCRVNNHFQVPNPPSSLAHVHNFFVRWLRKQGKSINILLR